MSARCRFDFFFYNGGKLREAYIVFKAICVQTIVIKKNKFIVQTKKKVTNA